MYAVDADIRILFVMGCSQTGCFAPGFTRNHPGPMVPMCLAALGTKIQINPTEAGMVINSKK